MKFARIIGRVTLNSAEPSLNGGRFLLAMPCGPAEKEPVPGKPLPNGNSFVVYDRLGASAPDLIAYTDGGEAAAPFAQPTPCDAFNAAILDEVNWNPPAND